MFRRALTIACKMRQSKLAVTAMVVESARQADWIKHNHYYNQVCLQGAGQEPICLVAWRVLAAALD